MDYWYSWLSKSSLEPELAYEYALLFARNELDGGDVKHFDHDFLLSMGVSIAKHRLEILKLAKKDTAVFSPWHPTRLVAAGMRQLRQSFAKYVCAVLVRRDKSAVVVVPRLPSRDVAGQWKGASMLKRSKKVALLKHTKKPLITYHGGSPDKATCPCASPPACNHVDGEEMADIGGGGRGDREDIKWEAMFQDLRPT